MIKIKSFAVNPFQVNSYIIYDDTLECVIIDAAIYTTREREEFVQFIIDNNLKPTRILSTHCHVDHILGNKFLSEQFNIGCFCHEEDNFLLEGCVEYGSMFGLDVEMPPAVSGFIYDNMNIDFGNSVIQSIHVPGHSPGSICYYNKEAKILITGDVLFDESIGRTDLPGGNYNNLISGIKQKLLVLDEDTKVFPGHGIYTTIKKEKFTNPFLVS